jgi:hypothetical protein
MPAFERLGDVVEHFTPQGAGAVPGPGTVYLAPSVVSGAGRPGS